MERPDIGCTAAVFQAGDTVETYLTRAIKIIDAHLGKGYAAKHPMLVAECVRSQTLDFNNCSLTAVLYAISDSLQSRNDN